MSVVIRTSTSGRGMWPRILRIFKGVRSPGLAAAGLVHTTADVVALSETKLQSLLPSKLATSMCCGWRLAVGVATVGAAFFNTTSDAAGCMPPREVRESRRKSPIMEEASALPASEDELEAILQRPLAVAEATAEEGTAEESTKHAKPKRSRVFEAFMENPADRKRCICRSNENARGGVCQESLATYVQSM